VDSRQLASVGISIWRLTEIIDHQAGFRPNLDWTFWCPTMILLSCLEVDLAVIAASMPVFWPMLEASFNGIFVTKEVHITRQVYFEGKEYELEEQGRNDSMASDKTPLRENTTASFAVCDMNAIMADEESKSGSVSCYTSPDSPSSVKKKSSKSGSATSWVEVYDSHERV
jgi:hypothetical protein